MQNKLINSSRKGKDIHKGCSSSLRGSSLLHIFSMYRFHCMKNSWVHKKRKQRIPRLPKLMDSIHFNMHYIRFPHHMRYTGLRMEYTLVGFNWIQIHKRIPHKKTNLYKPYIGAGMQNTLDKLTSQLVTLPYYLSEFEWHRNHNCKMCNLWEWFRHWSMCKINKIMNMGGKHY